MICHGLQSGREGFIKVSILTKTLDPTPNQILLTLTSTLGPTQLTLARTPEYNASPNPGTCAVDNPILRGFHL